MVQLPSRIYRTLSYSRSPGPVALGISLHSLPCSSLSLGFRVLVSMGDAHSTGCCSLHFEQLQIPEDLVFIVFKGAIQTSKRSERSIVLASYTTYKPQQ